jgi:hypothetical protein
MPPQPMMDDQGLDETTALVPVEALGGKKFKPGDTVQFQVVSVDDTGGLEVKLLESEGVKPADEAIDEIPEEEE